MLSLDTKRTNDLLKGIGDEEGNLDFASMVAAENVARSCLCGMLQKLQQVYEEGSGNVFTTIVDAFALACGGMRLNAKMQHCSLKART